MQSSLTGFDCFTHGPMKLDLNLKELQVLLFCLEPLYSDNRTLMRSVEMRTDLDTTMVVAVHYRICGVAMLLLFTGGPLIIDMK